jgi:hypothetical protein
MNQQQKQQQQHQNKNNKLSHSNSRSTRFNSKSFDCKGLLLLILFSCIMLVRNTYTGLTFVMLLIMKPDAIFGFGHDHNSHSHSHGHNHVQDDYYVNDNEYHSTNMQSNNPKVSPSTYASSIQASTSSSSSTTSSSYNARRMDVVQKPHAPSMNKSSVPHYAIL